MRRMEFRVRGGRRRGKLSAASATELLTALVQEAAGRARRGERQSALAAEAATFAVLSLTPRTLQSWSSLGSRRLRTVGSPVLGELAGRSFRSGHGAADILPHVDEADDEVIRLDPERSLHRVVVGGLAG